MGSVTSGLMMGIFLFFLAPAEAVAAAAAALMVPRSRLASAACSPRASSGLDGRVTAGPCSMEPVEMRRVAVGEGWSR